MWLTINRPARRNAISADVVAGFRAGIAAAQHDPDVRVIVVTGAGDKAFCAGADLAKGSGSFQFDPSRPHLDFAELLREAWRAPIPMIARVNGHCLAGGMGLFGVCDMAVAADHATFGLPEVKVGVFPAQVLSVLQHAIGPRQLAELCITGEPIDARRAEQIGLINYAVPAAELDAKTDWTDGRCQGTTPIVERINAALNGALGDASIRKRFETLGTENLVGSTPQSADAFGAGQRARWVPAVRAMGVKVD